MASEHSIKNHSRLKKYRNALKLIKEKVDEQSDNDDIWAIPVDKKQTPMEKYLKHELKMLHDVIESHTIPLLEGGDGPRPMGPH